jgi:hypothetical protein
MDCSDSAYWVTKMACQGWNSVVGAVGWVIERALDGLDGLVATAQSSLDAAAKTLEAAASRLKKLYMENGGAALSAAMDRCAANTKPASPLSIKAEVSLQNGVFDKPVTVEVGYAFCWNTEPQSLKCELDLNDLASSNCGSAMQQAGVEKAKAVPPATYMDTTVPGTTPSEPSPHCNPGGALDARIGFCGGCAGGQCYLLSSSGPLLSAERTAWWLSQKAKPHMYGGCGGGGCPEYWFDATTSVCKSTPRLS